MNEKSYCNKNFLIRCYDYTEKKSTLLRWAGLVNKVGYSRAKLIATAAKKDKTSKYTYRSRKGFKIDFYAI